MAAPTARYVLSGFLVGSISTGVITSICMKFVGRKDIDIEYEEGKTALPNQEYLRRASEILRFGVPDLGAHVRYFKNHVLAYDQARKIPIWVAEHLTAENLKGEANRKRSFFTPDENIHEFFRSANSDYFKSGWSRGHMAPAGNNKKDQTAMNESFLLSNILPQDLENNSGFWNRFEMYCRDLTKIYENVYVISGPLFLSYEEDGKRFVKYQVIGENEVAVPTHLYKVLVTEDKNKNLQLASFIVPNIPIDYSHKLVEYQVPLHQLEIKTGLKFFGDLNSKYLDLCSVHHCELTDGKAMDINFLTGDLSKAENLDRLNLFWKRVAKKGLQNEKSLKEAYNRRKAELKEL